MWRSLFIVALLASPALAQQPPSPNEQALGAKLMEEIGAGVQYRAAVISLQRENEQLKAELAKLKSEKSQPKE